MKKVFSFISKTIKSAVQILCTAYWESLPVQTIQDIQIKIWKSNLMVAGFAGCRIPNRVTNMFVTYIPGTPVHTIFMNRGSDATRHGILLHELAHIKLGHLELAGKLYTAGKIPVPVVTLDMEMEADRWAVEQGYGPQLLLGLIDLFEILRNNQKASPNLWQLDLRIKELREQVFA